MIPLKRYRHVYLRRNKKTADVFWWENNEVLSKSVRGYSPSKFDRVLKNGVFFDDICRDMYVETPEQQRIYLRIFTSV